MVGTTGLNVLLHRPYALLQVSHANLCVARQRHGKPVVLKLDAATMHQKGFAFFQADNGVWLTAAVPAAFLIVMS